MRNNVVPIDQAGRIVLPKNVREDLAINPGDTFTVSIEGLSVRLTVNKESTGFVRKGKALVFSTPGQESLSEESVRQILESGRAERDSFVVAGLKGRKRR